MLVELISYTRTLLSSGISDPFEYLKTQAQFAGDAKGKAPGLIDIAKDTFQRRGIVGFYSGVGALVAGNALKAAVRFFSYDQFKTLLVNQEGKLTGTRSLLGDCITPLWLIRRILTV